MVAVCTTRLNTQQFYVLPTERIYVCVLYRSQNKQRLFSYTTLTGWFYSRAGVCLLRGTICTFEYNSG
jgi:hypothetical protein